MELSEGFSGQTEDLAAFFEAVFSASEGASEGAVIGALAKGLLTTTPAPDLHVFTAHVEGALTGAIILTRLDYPDDARRVWLLSPVAVATDVQGTGVGQALISYGLKALQAKGADVALTYGDINFYAKVGFAQITPEIATPPQPLSYPHGWLGQSLTGAPLAPLKGASTCAKALSDPAYW